MVFVTFSSLFSHNAFEIVLECNEKEIERLSFNAMKKEKEHSLSIVADECSFRILIVVNIRLLY